jgi:hypothetical protein
MTMPQVQIPREIEIRAARLYEETTIEEFGCMQEWRYTSTKVKNMWRLKAFVEERNRYKKKG